jgi:hypothetical protein
MISVSRSTSSKDAELATYKAEAVSLLNELAGSTRLFFITDSAGQELVYQAKDAEAASYLLQSTEPTDLTGYPMLAAEIGITAPTPYELAQLWLNLSVQWKQVSGAIEAARLTAINGVLLATTKDEVDSFKVAGLSILLTIQGN